jgi:excisionase family DNA binding protein
MLPTNAHHTPLASLREVAAYLHVAQVTVRRYIKKRLLPATKIGGQIRVKWKDVDAFVNGGTGWLLE